jgi:hypothetical protein
MRFLLASLIVSLCLVAAAPAGAQDEAVAPTEVPADATPAEATDDAAMPAEAEDDATAPAEGKEASGITYAGGDGLSMDTAVVIVGAQGEMDGVDAEYRWLDEHAAGGEREAQSLVGSDDGRMFDVIVVAWPDGTKRTYYFDITAFFGKL